VRLPDNTLPHEPGEFAWHTETPVRHLAFVTPCGHHHCLPVNTDRGWAWDGSEDAPTLTPSILCCPGQCNWHGYLTAGELTSV
jgi:hypothetical protein